VADAIGVDGCQGGWIAASWDAHGAIGCRRVETLESLFAGSTRPSVMGIDVPIGLLPRGARECDVRAHPRRRDIVREVHPEVSFFSTRSSSSGARNASLPDRQPRSRPGRRATPTASAWRC
jgi:predicted RNase H-like nuclease